MKIIYLACLLLCGLAVCAQTKTVPYPTLGQIIRLDAQLDKLIPRDAKVEVLASGFVWAEGPVWVKEGGYLLFSDVPQNTIFKWTEKEGVTSFLKPSGYTGLSTYSEEPGSNGLTVDRRGQLIACEHGDRRITAMPLSGVGGKRTLADACQGKRFNSPNDIVAHTNGSYYFTDPPYGLPNREIDASREMDVCGVYRIAPSGQVSLLVSDLTRPNGVALSADEKILYVAQSDPQRPVIMAYPIRSDGSIGAGKVFFDAMPLIKQGLNRTPDGLKTDQAGNVWSSGPGGLLILSPAGQLLGRIDIGADISNCAWGNDGATLYITADMYVCRIRTTAKGVF